MIEIAQELLKGLEKNLEQHHVQVIGQINLQLAYAKKQAVSKKKRGEIKVAQRMIEATNRDLKEHVKGEFGKKINEVLVKQQQLLKNF
ncbi:hypothetical protein ACTNBL_05110 [Enterococcus villorum]|uniref:Uncharacterized protein n=2 Tax=Enterococcus villorum TaxID=112904 RepID=A0A511J2Z7_9ENTE|nr:hypothetical protein [Enterococcus villorum]EOH92536.1 hypothetical protein UAO_00422 [Enterococcus villorum ATCC 700913]EOW75639.1 hypothetical protein I591_02732 [Enterococcus villorum ATCC 700913]GEL92059.1 hypothetical protein EVI01_13960 [Enterococcus villorum]